MARRPGDPLDGIIARNIRYYREAAGLSQVALGDALRLSYQQIQKYESAANRVSASRLFRIAEVLGIPVTAFFTTQPLPQSRHSR